jgi:hypothetical protein
MIYTEFCEKTNSDCAAYFKNVGSILVARIKCMFWGAAVHMSRIWDMWDIGFLKVKMNEYCEVQ